MKVISVVRETDNSNTYEGAMAHAQKLLNYWHEQGYITVKVWVEHDTSMNVWTHRSNISQVVP